MSKKDKKSRAPASLGLFFGKDKPDCKSAWRLYQQGRDYNSQINLEDTVQKNENFFIGKQWEGIQANGLPTPQFNFLKRVALFIVSSITSENIKVNATPLEATANTSDLEAIARIVNDEFEAIMERENVTSLVREYSRNAAVDGDGCMYTYWDDKAETGQKAKGCVRTEIVENDRVYFGNPNDRRVQTQPWIIISKRQIVRLAKLKAWDNGIENWDDIKPDDDDNLTMDQAKRTDDKVTELLLFWRDDEDGHIWAYECTHLCATKEPWDTGLTLYPICWLNWDYVRDSYHGQAMITGLLPNQEFVNRAWAMSMLSLMRSGFPTKVFDSTRIKHLDNRVGAAIGVPGGNMQDVVKVIDPPAISPQVGQFIQLAVDQTETMLGATSVALGDTRPDNTSAIIALQRAAATPSELTKQNIYKSIEDLFRIYLEFMAEYYGKRTVDVKITDEMAQEAAMAGVELPDEVPAEFDFKQLKNHPMTLKLDVGASSYYSEIASLNTLDNLLQNGHISPLQYLERVPDGYIPGRRKLIDEMRSAMMMQPPMMEAGGMGGGPTLDQGQAPALPTGGGYSALQRKVNEAGTTAGIV